MDTEKRNLIQPQNWPRSYTLGDEGQPHESSDFPPPGMDTENGVREQFSVSQLIDRPMQTDKPRKTCANLTFVELQLLILLILATIIIILLSIVVVVLRATSFYYCSSPNCAKQAGIMLSIMNTSADPCNDFANYACGNWERIFVPKPGVGKYSGFYLATEKIRKLLYLLLEKGNTVIAHQNSSSVAAAVTYYKSCMNMDRRNKVGAQPLLQLINKTGGWTLTPSTPLQSSWKFIDTIAAVMEMNMHPVIGIKTGTNPYNSSNHIIDLSEGSGFYKREELLSTNPKFKQAFLKFGLTVVTILGATSPTETLAKLERVWKLEQDLARHRFNKVDSRNPQKTNNIMTLKEFHNNVLIRKFDIYKLLSLLYKVNFKGSEKILVTNPKYWKYIADKVKTVDQGDLANSIIFHLVTNVAMKLSNDFRGAFAAKRKVIYGSGILQPTWEICIGLTTTYFPLQVTAMYVQKDFSKKTKSDVEKIVHNIKVALIYEIKHADWMDDATKKRAVAKARNIMASVAYPDNLFNVRHLDSETKSVHLDPSEFFDNYMTIRTLRERISLDKLRKPVDRKAFTMAPVIANAYYSQTTVTIKILAGILQYPFFVDYFLKQSNYGALGSIVGHELNHGFDSRGQQFDEHGNLRHWWSRETVRKFQNKTQCFINQYSKYKFHGLYNRGQITVAENMADNAGIQTSLRAYKDYKNLHHDFNGFLPGLELRQIQLFFLSFAQMYCGYYTDAYAKHSIKVDVHSPYPHRILGTLSNQIDFAKVYGCPRGSRYNPSHRCVLW